MDIIHMTGQEEGQSTHVARDGKKIYQTLYKNAFNEFVDCQKCCSSFWMKLYLKNNKQGFKGAFIPLTCPTKLS